MKNKVIYKIDTIYFSLIFSGTTYSYYVATGNYAFRILALVCACLFYFSIFYFVFTSKDKREINNFRHKKLFFVYLCLVVTILFYSVKLNYKDLFTLFFHPYSFLGYFICIVLLTVNNYSFFRLMSISKMVNNLLPFFIFLDFAVLKNVISLHNLTYFTIFEFLFIDKLLKIRQKYIATLLLLEIILHYSFDNRAFVIRILGIVVAFLFFKKINIARYQYFRIVFLLSVITLLYFMTFYFFETFNYFTDLISDVSIDKTDTRTFLFYEFFEDFKSKDFFVGRGYLGTYYSSYFHDLQEEGGDHFIRFTLEVGILQILLKGGLVLLLPFLLMILVALYYGFINSTFNSISFRFSLILLVDLLLMGLENITSFSVHFMFIWLFIGFILNDKRLLHIKIIKKNNYIFYLRRSKHNIL